ncbi:MAG: Coenzyme F420 hydrogenase/dehydrogenase, beta subunit C-terminal domain [Pseudomonadota bacterium]
MRVFESLNEIVENGFCIGCGLCKSIAPKSAIEMRTGSHGHLRPFPRNRLDEKEERKILELCPGINVSGPLSEPGDRDDDPVWGHNLRSAKGHTTDDAMRFVASSGGIMTAINNFLLDTGRVNFVLQTAPDPDDPYGSIPVICRTAEDLLTAQGSRYASAATLGTIMEVLDLDEPFAVSLKPCDVAGVRNLQKVNSKARELVKFTQAMFCGTVPSVSSLEGFYERRTLDFYRDRPRSFRWRGNGNPGPTVAEMPDGSVLEATYQEMWDDNPWTSQLRCKLCPDAIGLQADIAVGDCWPGGIPVGEDEGWNAMIVHTETGLEILNACEADGRVKLVDIGSKHLCDVQPHHVRLRREMTSRLEGCKEMGMPNPNFMNLALEECAGQLTEQERTAARDGTVTRVKKGHGDNVPAGDI